ncbi:conserved hypothetical protein [Neospora caninum Liverpool]|nr:conserved hypothetical protein [Neospora caninum Liverpool]CBZ54303.1 conserved hypothetical protein [Neospora caninum Liverpool]|eukprot:XP_003884334.1 conserved hypothetical protein [Neospora caninum Liverpool]
MPAPCVQASLLHSPEARQILNASLRESLVEDPYFPLFQCPASSCLLPSLAAPAFASSSPQLFCVDQEGHACVVDWEGDFRERIEVPCSLESGASEAEAPGGTIRLKKAREDASPEHSDHTDAYVYEIAFPAVPSYRHPSPVSVSGTLRPVKRSWSVVRVKQEDGDSASFSTAASSHVVAGWQLAGPVNCATPIHPLMPDRFAFGGKENDIKVFDISQGRYIWAAKNVRQTLLQLRVAVHPTSLAWLSSIHPLLLAAGTAKGAVRLFDLRCQRRPVYELENAVRGTHDVIEKRVISAMAGEDVHTADPNGLWSILKAACSGDRFGASTLEKPDAQQTRNGAFLASNKVKKEAHARRDSEHAEKDANEAAYHGRDEKKRRKTAEGKGGRDKSGTLSAADVPVATEKNGDCCPQQEGTTALTPSFGEALKAQVRRLYGRQKANLYFADSYGAVYVHTVLTEDALMRYIDGAVKKHNKTSCCTTLSEEEENGDHQRTGKKRRWEDPRIRSKLLLAFQERQQRKLSSKKNASRLCTSPLNGPQYTTVFAGGFQGAVGAILALAEDVTGRCLVGVGYGRHAYVWRRSSRKLIEKVYLKQKLLAVLPSRKAVAGEEKKRGSETESEDSGASDGSEASSEEVDNEESGDEEAKVEGEDDDSENGQDDEEEENAEDGSGEDEDADSGEDDEDDSGEEDEDDSGEDEEDDSGEEEEDDSGEED